VLKRDLSPGFDLKTSPLSQYTGVAQVTKTERDSGNNQHSFIDRTGKIVSEGHTPPVFEHGYATVGIIGDKAAVLNTAGQQVIPFGRYRYIQQSGLLGVFIVRNASGRHGLVDATGRVIIPPSVPLFIHPFEHGFARISYGQNAEQHTLIDSNFKELFIPESHVNYYPLSENAIIKVKRTPAVGGWGYEYSVIDRTGRVITPVGTYKNMRIDYTTRDMSPGSLVPVYDGNLWGFIGSQGQLAIPFQFENGPANIPNNVLSINFKNGKAAVKHNGTWYILTDNGYRPPAPPTPTLPTSATPAQSTTQAPPAQPPIKVTLNGEELSFNQPPITQDGRTLVPLRQIFESMGATVNFGNNTVTATKDSTTIYLTGKTPFPATSI
jgi:hypothetical protein